MTATSNDTHRKRQSWQAAVRSWNPNIAGRSANIGTRLRDRGAPAV